MRFREILDLARLVVLARPGVADRAASSAMLVGGARRDVPRVRLVANTPVETSSTEVRRLLARGERPPPGWVPEPVIDFALKYRLYR